MPAWCAFSENALGVYGVTGAAKHVQPPEPLEQDMRPRRCACVQRGSGCGRCVARWKPAVVRYSIFCSPRQVCVVIQSAAGMLR